MPCFMARLGTICSFSGFILFLCFVTSFAVQPSNIVLLVTDDQDAEIGVFMTKLSTVFRQEGTTFYNAYATTPICCPARSSLLTGVYQHRHRVYNNSKSGGCNGKSWQADWEPISLGPQLQAVGYKTFYAGKYLNQYKGDRVPPGWDWWAGLDGNSVYYNYTINVNGTRRVFGDKPEDYLTDVLSGWAVDFLQNLDSRPFFMIIATPAPHEPFTPSKKYEGTVKNIQAPRTKNFNYGKDNKHWIVRSGKPLNTETVGVIDEAYCKRIETLKSVDDLFHTVNSLLPQNTYFMFTSDHGFHMGQFSQPWDKRQPYEADIKIPLKIKGPGIASGTTLPHPVTNLDIAATIFEIAGVKPALLIDGKSFLQTLISPSTNWGRQFFIEYHGEGGGGAPCNNDINVKLCSPNLECNCFDARNNTFKCIRRITKEDDTISCFFFDSENFQEYYDLNRDPYQLNNLAWKLNL